jgi:hypothetical protein
MIEAINNDPIQREAFRISQNIEKYVEACMLHHFFNNGVLASHSLFQKYCSDEEYIGNKFQIIINHYQFYLCNQFVPSSMLYYWTDIDYLTRRITRICSGIGSLCGWTSLWGLLQIITIVIVFLMQRNGLLICHCNCTEWFRVDSIVSWDYNWAQW